MKINFSSTRLEFRTLDTNDVTDRYVNWLNDPEVNRYLEIRFSTHNIKSCLEFVSRTNSEHYSHLFGIFDPIKKIHIGNIKIGFINEIYKSGQISLLIGDKSYWGKGYATESIRAMTNWTFNNLKLERIEAGCCDANMGSLKAFIKSGYTIEGYFRKNTIIDNERVGSFWLGILRNEFRE